MNDEVKNEQHIVISDASATICRSSRSDLKLVRKERLEAM